MTLGFIRNPYGFSQTQLELAAAGRGTNSASIQIRNIALNGVQVAKAVSKVGSDQFSLTIGKKGDIAIPASQSMADHHTQLNFNKDTRIVTVTDLAQGKTVVLIGQQQQTLAKDQSLELSFDHTWSIRIGKGTYIHNSPECGHFVLTRCVGNSNDDANEGSLVLAVHQKLPSIDP